MPVDTDVTPAQVLLKALADPVRWRIVRSLAVEELCVCHLVEALGVPQPLVSHHLRVLRECDLVETSRFRYWTYYRLRAETLAALGQTLRGLAEYAPSPGEVRRPCC